MLINKSKGRNPLVSSFTLLKLTEMLIFGKEAI